MIAMSTVSLSPLGQVVFSNCSDFLSESRCHCEVLRGFQVLGSVPRGIRQVILLLAHLTDEEA